MKIWKLQRIRKNSNNKFKEFTIMSYIKRHQLGAKINKRIYDAVDPTQDYPGTAHSIKLGRDVIKGNKADKIKEPVADAA